MSEQFRILVVEDEETLNQSIVNSLRRDGYLVQGVMSGAEAIRILWTEECDVVISDQKTPGADGFELLQWLRTNRPNTHMIMLSAYGSPETRALAFESGVVSYLEKPLNLHLLKEELRRLFQQTGFSASLDSFDLLDVIQIITMSRKSIALLINTGLEERGVLRFQDGELIWAEYGILRGEEAFFALAAHMNGTVIHQPWNEQIQPNVSQPLSRLIFQALQYRSKYAIRQQQTGEQAAFTQQSAQQRQAQVQTQELKPDEIDDSPFVFVQEPFAPREANAEMSQKQGEQGGREAEQRAEWWQATEHGQANGTQAGNGRVPGDIPATPGRRRLTGNTNIMPSVVRKTPASQRPDLPSWLTEQPAKGDSQAQPPRPAALSSSTHLPVTPAVRPSPAEWQPPVQPVPPSAHTTTRSAPPVPRIPATPGQPTQPTPVVKVTEQLPERQTSGTQHSISSPMPGVSRQSSPEWQQSEQETGSGQGQLQSLTTPLPPSNGNSHQGQVQGTRHNYPALISALQTLGYSIPGFVAAAVVGLDGQPIAQVAVGDLDTSQVCGYFSTILLGVLRSLELGGWGDHEETVISSENRHILLRIVGSKSSAFQVLITTREAEPSESLEVMANVEGAISAALH